MEQGVLDALVQIRDSRTDSDISVKAIQFQLDHSRLWIPVLEYIAERKPASAVIISGRRPEAPADIPVGPNVTYAKSWDHLTRNRTGYFIITRSVVR